MWMRRIGAFLAMMVLVIALPSNELRAWSKKKEQTITFPIGHPTFGYYGTNWSSFPERFAQDYVSPPPRANPKDPGELPIPKKEDLKTGDGKDAKGEDKVKNPGKEKGQPDPARDVPPKQSNK